MDILSQSALLVAITSFALGFSVLAKNVRNKLFLAFAVVCTVLSAWSLFFFLERLWGGGEFYRFHLLFNIWLTPAALAFIRVLVRIHDRFSRRLLEISVVFTVLLTGALLFGVDQDVNLIKQLILFTPGFIAIQTLQLMWIDRGLAQGRLRQSKVPTVGLGRRNLIYLGALLVLATSVMDHVPWTGHIVPVIGNLALTVYVFFLSQAITQQRLMNFPALFSRFMVLLAMALTLTAIYSLLFAYIADNPALFFLNSFIVSFLIVMLIEPLRRLVAYTTQRFLTQKHLRLEELLREARRELTRIVDPGPLFQAILETADRTLQPEGAALFVLKRDMTRYRRVRAAGAASDGDAPREILVDHPVLAHARKLQAKGELPMVLDQILESEIDRSASRTQRGELRGLADDLRSLGGNLLIPLMEGRPAEGGLILGFVVLRVPAPPEPWGGNWSLLRIIYPYFEQAAQTMRNLEVYVRSREKDRLAALGEMAAGLAHEIRNPLGAIKGAAQFLDPSADRPESRFLEVIIEEVDRLNRVVTQFLDYSKPHHLDAEPVELNRLADRTLELLRPTLRPSVELAFRPSAASAIVSGSPEQLKQVLLNLVQNSLKALEGRVAGGRVQVRVEAGVENRSREVLIEVEDNGPGIQRENLEKLFIPFFTTSPSGTGLGLSICQKIIEAHRGRIEVASEEGKFARFSVVLPSAEGGASPRVGEPQA